MNIDADVKQIRSLKDYFFIVPDYQREYVWEPEDQVEQFIIDIDNEFEPHNKVQNNYFIGSIIIVENNNKYDVIDGQQRLTTIILSLCAFRDLLRPLTLSDLEKKYLQVIEELLSDFDISTNELKLRLELQYDESKDYLKRLIEARRYDDKVTASIHKMQLAYQKLKSHFQHYLDEGIKGFIQFAQYFLTNIDLVIIKSENLSSALKIFETINQRGAGLNAMDLVKNLLFSKANEDDFQKIKLIWKEITANLQNCKEGKNPLRFLRYFVMARYTEGIIREDDIYKWFISKEGKEATNYEIDPLSFAKELNKISKRYSDLVIATELVKDGGDYPHVTNIGFVNKYKSRQHLVLLLALDISASNVEIEYLGEQIESFFFYSNVLGIQAKNNERLFASWARKIRQESALSGVRNVIETTMLPYIKEKIGEFKSTFMNLRHYAFNPLYRQRYILGKIENTILLKSGMPLKGQNFYDSLQIEHILPQTPKDGILPDSFLDRDSYIHSVYKLGNVLLLEGTINQAVNNFNDMQGNWFEKKQIEYAKSNVTSTNLINADFMIGQDTALNRFKASYNYNFQKWDASTVDLRQALLMELAFETWKLNGVRVDK